MQGGLRGGCRGVIAPLRRGYGVSPLRKKILGKRVTFFPCLLCRLDFHVHCWAVFWYMVFFDGFLFPVKELGLLTNPSHWVRVLDASGSYMYVVL
jgi:hypothetical protein